MKSVFRTLLGLIYLAFVVSSILQAAAGAYAEAIWPLVIALLALAILRSCT